MSGVSGSPNSREAGQADAKWPLTSSFAHSVFSSLPQDPTDRTTDARRAAYVAGRAGHAGTSRGGGPAVWFTSLSTGLSSHLSRPSASPRGELGTEWGSQQGKVGHRESRSEQWKSSSGRAGILFNTTRVQIDGSWVHKQTVHFNCGMS